MSPGNSKQETVQKGYIEIDAERCKGCKLCISACPRELITISEALNSAGHYPAMPNAMLECTACGMCWQICPDAAITVYKREKEGAE